MSERAKPTMTEREWSQLIVDACALFGRKCYRTHDSRRSPAGFPDLVIVLDEVIFAELKTDSGALTDAQRDWLNALTDPTSARVFVWRPKHWDAVERLLRKGLYGTPGPLDLEALGVWPYGERAR